MHFWRVCLLCCASLLAAWWFFFSGIAALLYSSPTISQNYIGQEAYQELGTSRVQNQHTNLIQFLIGDEPLTQAWYTTKEIRHMNDVQKLVKISAIIWIMIVCGFIILRTRIFKHLKTILIGSLVWTVLLVIGIIVSFQTLFYQAHQILFTNTDWLLDPAIEKLVILYDQRFFGYFFGTALFISMTLQCLLLLYVVSPKKQRLT